jgi:hypothetical protein
MAERCMLKEKMYATKLMPAYFNEAEVVLSKTM